MNRVRVGGIYRYEPVGMDIWSPCNASLKSGALVKVINIYGCPPANTMGHCYVENFIGTFQGLVLCNSLVEASVEDKKEWKNYKKTTIMK
jgi:hypothetical protein